MFGTYTAVSLQRSVGGIQALPVRRVSIVAVVELPPRSIEGTAVAPAVDRHREDRARRTLVARLEDDWANQLSETAILQGVHSTSSKTMNSVWYVTTLGGESWHSQNTDEPSVAIIVNAWPLCRLGEQLCSRQRAVAVAENRVPLVRPADVDRFSGAQMPYEYADLQPVMMLGRELAHGDILVPRNPTIPAILVGPSHAQCAFSTAFIAIRAQHQRMAGEYLWMLLCSTRGMRARAALSEHYFEFESLERLEVAVPPLEKQRMRSIHAPGVHWVSAESSWQVGDLSQVRSWTFGTSLVEGETITLGDLVDVNNGSMDDNELFAVTAKGRVPVLTSVPSIQEGPEFWGHAREDQVSDGAWIAISPQYPFSSAIVPRGWRWPDPFSSSEPLPIVRVN